MNVPCPGRHRSSSLIALLVITSGCVADPPGGDGGALDAHRPAVSCMPDVIEGPTCQYWGYGTTCPVPCAFPPDCSFSVRVGWTGNSYCCGTFEGWFDGCVCEDGFAVCEPDLRGVRHPPTSTCEFCSEPDGGLDGGTDGGTDAALDGPVDAATDADPDASTDDDGTVPPGSG